MLMIIPAKMHYKLVDNEPVLCSAAEVLTEDHAKCMFQSRLLTRRGEIIISTVFTGISQPPPDGYKSLEPWVFETRIFARNHPRSMEVHHFYKGQRAIDHHIGLFVHMLMEEKPASWWQRCWHWLFVSPLTLPDIHNLPPISRQTAAGWSTI